MGRRARPTATSCGWFGASGEAPGAVTVHFAHVIDFLRGYVRESWDEILARRTKDPALDWIVIEEKARRGLGDRT